MNAYVLPISARHENASLINFMLFITIYYIQIKKKNNNVDHTHMKQMLYNQEVMFII